MVHNFYGSAAPSGENLVFELERNLLEGRGHEVMAFTRHSDEIRTQGAWGVIRGALATPWNPWSANAIRKAVSGFKPDIVHAHNTFPLISPSIFHAIGQQAARVLTLHNYRLFCPAAIPMRNGAVCTECLDRHSALPAVAYGCYRNSRLATLPLAAGVGLHRALGTWTRQVDSFICLTEFQRERMIASGLPADKVHVKPNFFPGKPAALPWSERSDYAVFAGRLSGEKGVEYLVRAWLEWGEAAPELRILGDGPLRDSLARLAGARPEIRIRFIGQIGSEAAQHEIAHARLLILPSICFEGFPMVIREAFAYGVPAAVSGIGPLPSIVADQVSGLVFKAADASALLRSVRSSWEHPGMLEKLGQGARASYERDYNEDANYQRLMAIYAAAIETSRDHAKQQAASY